MRFSVYTLGCKLNQLETEAITDSFCRQGFSFTPFGSEEPLLSGDPGVVVINTCTVTSMAEQKARRIIRKLLREQPEACLIVTGCYAQMEREALSGLEAEVPSGGGRAKRLFVIPGEKKDRLLDLPRFLNETASPRVLPELIGLWLASIMDKGEEGNTPGAFRFKPENFSSHSRGFLKIQDGCDRRCAYCRVSLARGKSRSLRAAAALEELRSMEKRGIGEAVLTGVNISLYRDSGMTLPELLTTLLQGTDNIRLRLSSIEPQCEPQSEHETGGLSQDFIKVLKNPRIRPHFHLSLQSGSDEVLRKMGRPYTRASIERTAARLRSAREDPFLACDIIAGFPGETNEEFEKTRELCEKTGFAWIHTFPYSKRPGTAAYNFSGTVSEGDVKKRVEILNELAQRGRREYIRRWEGREVEAIAEAGKQPGASVPAVSENYLKLLVHCGARMPPVPGSLIRCRILGTQKPMETHYDAPAELLS